MKSKLLVVIAALVVFCSANAFAESVTQLTIGGSSANDIGGKTGLAIDTVYWSEINYLFAWGFNAEMIWYKWDRQVVDEDGNKVYQDVDVDGDGDYESQPVKETANAFLFPVMAGAKIQYPVNSFLTPYVAGGLGWSFMPLLSDNDETSNFYNGFSWQIHGGTTVSVPDLDNFRFVLDVKYRDAHIRNSDSVEIDMSGWQFSAGVQYGFMQTKSRSSSTSW